MKILILFLFLPLIALADAVVPIDEVENSVNIRLSPDASSEVVGKLNQGSSAVLVESIEGWHEIQLEGGSTGFISADWSRVVVGTDVAEIVAETEIETEVTEAAVEAVAGQVVAEVVEIAGKTESVDEEIIDAVVNEDAVIPDSTEIETVVEVPAEPESENEAIAGPVEATVVTVTDATDESVVELKGTRNFLVRFRDVREGGNSQVYDNGNRIGIGTTEPKQRLEVNGSIQIHEQNSSVAGLMITQSTGDTGYIMHNRASTLTIGAGSQDRITIDRDGNVGFAVARPKHPLEMASGAHVTAGGVWTNSSSRFGKENIEALSAEDATLALMALDPVIFNYREEQGEEYVGFIAEDVPELVANRDRNALSAMDIVAVLTRVVQDQQKKITALEQKLDSL